MWDAPVLRHYYSRRQGHQSLAEATLSVSLASFSTSVGSGQMAPALDRGWRLTEELSGGRGGAIIVGTVKYRNIS